MPAGRLVRRTLTVALGAVWLLGGRGAHADRDQDAGPGAPGASSGGTPRQGNASNSSAKGRPPASGDGQGSTAAGASVADPPSSDRAAPGEASVGPRRGEGQRSIEPAPTGDDAIPARSGPSDTKSSAAPARQSASPSKASKAHQRGRAPKKPAAKLPDGAARPDPDRSARRLIADGPTRDDELRHPDDPELQALLAADRMLFPRPLEGVEPGWSWDLPEPDEAGPALWASGVPPSERLDPAGAMNPSVVEAAWLRALALPDLPVRFDGRVVKYLEFYRNSSSGRAIIRAWAKKAGRYAPMVRDALARAGLPRDLAWLSLIESGYNPEIHSPAGAAGLWQLVPETARIYGLVVDRWVDERLDPQRSTEAAIRYLDDLRRRFGSWELAMAAYNMGHAGLARSIKKYSSNDYWELSRHEAGIPWETALYVPKILAVALVMNNKRAFRVDDVQPDPSVEHDSVLVGAGVSLSRVAAAAEVSVALLEQLNPQLIGARTPVAVPGQRAKTYPVRVPRGAAVLATKKLASAGAARADLDAVLVRFGDSLEDIARRSGVSEAKLRELNGLGTSGEPMPDSVLLVPPSPDGLAQPSSAPEPVVVPATPFAYDDRERVFYRVLPGDTVDRVASAFGVTRDELVTWNAIDAGARLQAGMWLQVYVAKGIGLERVACLREDEVKALVVGSPEFIDYFEAQQGRKRVQVVVREGDTLRSIGKRYGLSVGSMERINRRSNRDPLNAGERLIVYVPASTTPAAAAPGAPSPLEAAAPPHPELLPAAYEVPPAP